MTPSLILTIALAAGMAQSFEVVSIKPNNSNSGGSRQRANPGIVISENITTNSMIQQAFGVRGFQISGGPGWMNTDDFDVNAKTGTSKDLNAEERQPYWLSLLTERFGMKYHRESKEMAVYSLLPAKGGAKLTPHPEPGDSMTSSSNRDGRSTLNSTNVTVKRLAEILGARLERKVIDNTGLEGGYDIKLEWAQDPSAESTIPSLFTALQEQLGLKLESTRGPVEMIVIDSLEKPTEN